MLGIFDGFARSQFDGGDPFTLVRDMMKLAQRGYPDLEHFWGDNPDSNKSGSQSYSEVSTNNGASAFGNTPPNVGRAMGVHLAALSTTTTGANGAGFRSGVHRLEGTAADDRLYGRCTTVTRTMLRNSLPVTGTDEFRGMPVGLVDFETSQVEPSDGWYIWFDENSSNWILKHATSSTRVTADTGIAVALDEWHVWAVVADAASGIVTAYHGADQSPLVEVATVEPVTIQPASAIGLSDGAFISSPAAAVVTTAPQMFTDYIVRAHEYGGLY